MAYKKKSEIASGSLRIFKEQVKNKKLLPLYVFCGEEDYLKARYLDRLKSIILGKNGFDEFNYAEIEEKAFNVPGFCDAVENLPMMSEGKLVVVRDYDASAVKNSNEKAAFKNCMEALDESVCVVFYYQAKEYNAEKSGLTQYLGENGMAVSFDYMEDSELIKWISKRVIDGGKQIEAAAVKKFVEQCGSSMMNLDREISKVAAFCVEDDVITWAKMEKVITPSVEASVYELTDALAYRRYDRAMEIIDTLLRNREEPVSIVNAVGRTFTQMYKITVALSEGYSQEKIASELWLKPFIVKKAVENRYSTAEKLRKWVDIAARADMRLKSSPMEPRTVIETMVGEIAAN